ncbi:centrosomal protein of 152 kDa [Pelodytes ibericus]
MSIDFDSGALQTQQDDEEYDKEDFAREQELQQLLTDLPHDMLDDSLSSSPEPNYSDCSDHEILQQNSRWDPDTSVGSGKGIPNQAKVPHYNHGYTGKQYCSDYVGKQDHPRNQAVGEKLSNGWSTVPSDNEENMYGVNYIYAEEHGTNESNAEEFHHDNHYDAPGPCSNSDLYHLPEDFQPYTNGHQQTDSFPDSKREHFQRFLTSEITNNHPAESVQVTYHPYQPNGVRKDLVNQDPSGRDDHFDDLQRQFLDTGESSASNMQYVQLQVLYKARGRQLQELNEKLEETEQQMRYLNHQLVLVKDEKEGLTVSLQESQVLLQNAKETEIQLKGQLTALEKTVEGLTTNEDQLRKEFKVAKVAMESMQKQVLDMRRSDSIQRARDQHEAVVSMLTKKNEEQVFALQQRLDDVNAAFLEQKELCCRLENEVKQAERKREESKLEKTEIINRLSRSLEECQNQCANLLQTGSIQEATQLRMQLQQVQSSKMISDGMNKALHDEISELKEQITMYESAANLDVFINSGEQDQLSDSYADLGIKKINWQKSRFQRAMHSNGTGKDLSEDEVIHELKTELERCLNSNRAKRQQIIQLQSDLKANHLKTEEMKKSLEKAEKTARDCEIRTGSLEKQLDPAFPYSQASSEALKEEVQKHLNEKLLLQQEVEKYLLCIQELKANEDKMKTANQELCNEMRAMIQDFDRDKKEAIERCERTYEQHTDDIKRHFQMDLSERFESEKDQLSQRYEEQISQLQSQIDEMTRELTAVQECYITVCKEKDTLEDTVRESVKSEFQINEEKLKEKLLQETEKSMQALKADLADKHQSALSEAKARWQGEREFELKQQIEAHVALAKENWIKEQSQITEKNIQEIEKEWKHKLDKVLQDTKSKTTQDFDDIAIQTEQSMIAVDTTHVEELKTKLQDALQDKERAIREERRELERQYHNDISKQVEMALTKAHARWLEELTSLSEYKMNLKMEQEKWEKQNEIDVKKQISEALSAAEDNWRIRGEKVDFIIKQKEFEEKLASVHRELELKNEECQAMIRTELAKARAQWNKEKQDEIQQIQAQNEEDYRTFLDAHRSKISEVLSTAKGDFEKQNNGLIAKKEAEMTERLNQSLKQCASEASQQLQEHENNILAEMELVLSEIHDELVDKCVAKDRLSVSNNPDLRFLNRLRDCLRRAITGIVYKVLANAKQEWNQKLDSTPNTKEQGITSSERERSSAPKMTKKSHLDKLSNGSIQMVTNHDPNVGRKDSGCELCSQTIEKSKKECHELRSKLDKACRHLQQAVKEQKLKAEQIQENENKVETLRQENKALLEKLEEMKVIQAQASLQPEEGSGSGCAVCKGNALEEMRAQYIKAVDKIKNDMLRYIHESKGRAAEMLKSEVLRERQETARKMRKYYLTCLQQLLKDDGKNEGAEKKIMNAASKLATMAKVLETPISQKCQSKNLQTALSLRKVVLPETEPEKNDSLKTIQTLANNRQMDQNIEQNTMDEFIKRHVREKSEGSNALNPDEASAARNDNGIKRLQMEYPNNSQMQCLYSVTSPFLTHTSFEKANTFSCIESKAQSDQALYRGQDEPSFLQNVKDYYHEESKTKSDKQRFDLQETPVRDENASNDWSCVGGKGLIPFHSAQTSSNSFQMQPQTCNNPESFPAAGFCSLAQARHDPFGSGSEGQHYSAHTVRKKDTRHANKIIGPSYPAVENHPESKVYSDVDRVSKLLSRKLLHNDVSPKQDSGFDSPFYNFS